MQSFLCIWCLILNVEYCTLDSVVQCGCWFALCRVVGSHSVLHLSKEEAAEEEVDDEKTINKSVEPLDKGEDGRAWSDQDILRVCIQNYCLAPASSSGTSLSSFG